MSPEDFKNITAGFQSILVGLAVLCGGAWAIYRFFALRELSAARIGLATKELEIKQRSLLNIALDSTVTSGTGELGRWVLAIATVHNPGNHPEVIVWSKSGLRVLPVKKSSEGAISFGEPLDSVVMKGNEVFSSSISPGETASFAFAVPVDVGLYHVEFYCAVNASKKEAERLHADAGVPVNTLYWTAPRFVEVTTSNQTRPNEASDRIFPPSI
jgi:hypothetical protein